jgi:hypothetical protein
MRYGCGAAAHIKSVFARIGVFWILKLQLDGWPKLVGFGFTDHFPDGAYFI